MGENRRAELRAGSDLEWGFVFSHRPAVRRKRRGADHGLEERSVREISAYSTAYPERARVAVYRPPPRCSIRYRLKMKSDRPPR
jgi:hypothetical protein